MRSSNNASDDSEEEDVVQKSMSLPPHPPSGPPPLHSFAGQGEVMMDVEEVMKRQATPLKVNNSD